MSKLANTAIAFPAAGSAVACLKRLGACGFWFFFLKGMLWLIAPYVVYAVSSLALGTG